MRLKEIRKSLGLSQKQVCDYIGCSGTVYSRYETGKREPSIGTVLKIAEFYGVSLDYLVGNKEFEERSLSDSESELLSVYRKADKRSREDAYQLLVLHQL